MQKTWLKVLCLIVFGLFFFKAITFLDPDFGWHYQMGKLIIESGVPKLDQFSYTMSNFLYIDHEWLTDVFIYKLYGYVGMIGLSVLWSMMALFILGISIFKIIPLKKNNIKSKNITIIQTAAFLLGSGLIMSQFGIRPQVVSWLFLSILLWILSNWEKSKLNRFLTPLLFLIWAKLHGGFALGIVILGVVLAIKSFKDRKTFFPNLVIFIFSVLFTFVNPYGINLWKEVFNTFFSTSLRGKIEEWKPVWTGLNVCYPLIVVFAFVLMVRFKKCFSIEFILLFLILLAMSVSALINLPIFVIVATSFLISGIVLIEKESINIKFGKDRFNKALKFFSGLTIFLFIFSSFFAVRGAIQLSEDNFYPKDAVSYISKNMPSGEIFSNYNWGGYLIWKLPEKKVFVDGRMSHWPGILDYQSQILLGKIDYREVFNKYNIQMVLWPKKDKDDIFVDRIKKDGWKVVYFDTVSQILIKN